MHITELTAFHVRIPLKKTIRHASHTRTENDTLLVRCRLDDGTLGWGEGLPRPYVTGETIETAFEQLRATDLSRQLDARFDGLCGVVPLLTQFRPDAAGYTRRDCFGNAVRCAVEISILDAVARAEGRPLSAVTALLPETEPIRRSADRVRYSGAITAARPLKEAFRALQVRIYGFHQCKVKVGLPNADDAASLRRIRGILGDKIDVRIDANEAWTCENLLSKLEPLVRYRISAVEQPVPHADVDGLAAVRKRIGVPIMLDESLCSYADGERAIERGACDLFNIRLSKCGGFLNSLRLAALAQRSGPAYQLGCQVGETGVLSAAGRHFASSVGGIRYLEGSYDRHLVRERLTVEDLTFQYGGWAPALTAPGLGITMDPAALRRVTLSEQRWTIRN